MQNPSQPGAPASPRQVLLGLFIIAQLLYMLLNNTLGFVMWSTSHYGDEWGPLVDRVAPRFAKEQGHGWQWCDELQKNMRRWSQLTLQDEQWNLFAPDVGKGCCFPVVLLLNTDPGAADQGLPDWRPSFDARFGHHVNFGTGQPMDAVALLLSENEPQDVGAFFRVGNSRGRGFENDIWVSPLCKTIKTPGEDPAERLETSAEAAARLTRQVRNLAIDERETSLAYMKWRLRSWQQAHADAPPPTQVILLDRFYRIHAPDEGHGWDGPFVVPIMRWRPKTDQPHAEILLESYDFDQHRFSPVQP